MRLPWILALVPCLGCSADAYLTDLADEPPGANCPSGGIRISTGADSNGNGKLDPEEVDQSKYACAGGSNLVAVSDEPAGTNCPAGGAKIETGADTNLNGMLDADEVTGTQYVCGSGNAQIVRAFEGSMNGVTASAGTPMTVLSAQITTTTPGQLYAIASTDIYCTAAQCPAGAPVADGYLWISSVDNLGVPFDGYDYFHLDPDTSFPVTRSNGFTLDTPGTYTYYLRGQDLHEDFTFYRSELTLVFVP